MNQSPPRLNSVPNAVIALLIAAIAVAVLAMPVTIFLRVLGPYE
jgi:hypothetical protein